MNLSYTVTSTELLDLLQNVAPTRPVFIWGVPGIGKSALVEEFASEVGIPCVSLLGSKLAPEDIIGIPQIRGETSEFLSSKMIARKEPYVLFLNELNTCSQDSAIVKTMSSVLINCMVHIQLTDDPRNWLKWAQENGIHP